MATPNDIGRLDFVTVSDRLNDERTRLRNAASSLLVTISLLEWSDSRVGS